MLMPRVGIDNTHVKFAFLDGLKARLGDMSPLLTGVATLLRKSFAQNFAAQGRPDPWKALSPKYEARKRRMFESGRIRGRDVMGNRVRGNNLRGGSMPGILVLTGGLKDAVSRRGKQGNITRFGNDKHSVVVGVGKILQRDTGKMLPLGYWHDQGRGHNPVRQIITVQDHDMIEIVGMTTSYICGTPPPDSRDQ